MTDPQDRVLVIQCRCGQEVVQHRPPPDQRWVHARSQSVYCYPEPDPLGDPIAWPSGGDGFYRIKAWRGERHFGDHLGVTAKTAWRAGLFQAMGADRIAVRRARSHPPALVAEWTPSAGWHRMDDDLFAAAITADESGLRDPDGSMRGSLDAQRRYLVSRSRLIEQLEFAADMRGESSRAEEIVTAFERDAASRGVQRGGYEYWHAAAEWCESEAALAIKSRMTPTAPPPPPPPEPAPAPAPRNWFARLAVLDQLVREGGISEADAAAKRKSIIEERRSSRRSGD